MDQILLRLSENIKEETNVALCVVVSTQGSTPRKIGAKMLVYNDGSIFGTVGGGTIEKQIISDANQVLKKGVPVTKEYNLDKDLYMHCGGKMEIYIEPYGKSFRLFIFGAGHIGQSLAGFARKFGFKVTLFDERKEFFKDPVINDCELIVDQFSDAIEKQSFDEKTFIVIVSPQHIKDEEILAITAKKPHAYIGMIGSRKKVELARKRFLEENILTQSQLDAIDMPIGLKFNAETPEEIAISILAKLIDRKNSL